MPPRRAPPVKGSCNISFESCQIGRILCAARRCGTRYSNSSLAVCFEPPTGQPVSPGTQIAISVSASLLLGVLLGVRMQQHDGSLWQHYPRAALFTLQGPSNIFHSQGHATPAASGLHFALASKNPIGTSPLLAPTKTNMNAAMHSYAILTAGVDEQQPYKYSITTSFQSSFPSVSLILSSSFQAIWSHSAGCKPQFLLRTQQDIFA